MSGRRGFVTMVAGMLMAVPALASAQVPRIDLPIAVGQKVSITTDDGRTTKGRVVKVTPASVELGDTNLAVAAVRRIQVLDPLRDGIGKGATLGGLLGVLAGVVADSSESERGHSATRSTGAVAGLVTGIGAGALLGAAVDSLRHKTVYTRETARTSIAVRPIVSAAGKGVGVRLRW